MKYTYDALKGLTIGLSISESPDLIQMNMGKAHLQDAWIGLSQQLLAGGAKIAYGGTVNYYEDQNFAEILFQLALKYAKHAQKPSEKILNYVAWPYHLKLTANDKAKLIKVAKFEEVPLPAGVVPPDGRYDISRHQEPESKYIMARSLTYMREEMTKKVDARIILGGKLVGYSGKYPGLLEEAYLTLRANKPLYLLPSFGGCTHALYKALQGGWPESLSETRQLTSLPYKQFTNYYNRIAAQDGSLEVIDNDQMLTYFNKVGIKSLNNGLTVDENHQLAQSRYMPEIIKLILKGLHHIQNRRR